MITLTEPQERLWEYLKGCKASPSFDEMTDAMGLHSKNSIFRLLEGLERKGYIHSIRRGGRRVVRGVMVHPAPRPDLAGYRTEELAEELALRERLAA